MRPRGSLLSFVSLEGGVMGVASWVMSYSLYPIDRDNDLIVHTILFPMGTLYLYIYIYMRIYTLLRLP